jgi:uncharacterized protein YdeI (YjbR/CyaY-like superfamily)
MTAPPPDAKPKFFASPAAFRTWLERHHAKAKVLWVGFHKRDTGVASITWPESVDEALCFGWIDGVRYRVDADRYMIRFTPRRADSIWSSVNIRRMKVLFRAGRVTPAGEAAWEARDAKRSGVYSFEQRKEVVLDPVLQRRFQANATAWGFFSDQAPWYRRTTVFWVMSAKKPETREKRLSTLIADSAARKRIKGLEREKK